MNQISGKELTVHTMHIYVSPIIFSYLGDGRFHLEAVMIANPSIPAYRYAGIICYSTITPSISMNLMRRIFKD